MAREKQLSDELLALGLSPEQIASIMAVPSLNIADIYATNAASRRQTPESQRTSLSGVTRKLKSPRKSRGGFPINFFPWYAHISDIRIMLKLKANELYVGDKTIHLIRMTVKALRIPTRRKTSLIKAVVEMMTQSLSSSG